MTSSRSAVRPGCPGHLGSGFAGPRPLKMSPPPPMPRGRARDTATGACGGAVRVAGPCARGSREAAVARSGRSSGGCRPAERERALRSRRMPRVRRGRCSSARRTSRRAIRGGARSRAQTAAHARGCVRVPARRCRHARRGCGVGRRSSSRRATGRETMGTRSFARAKDPCCRPRTARAVRTDARTRRGRRRRRARGAPGRGCGRPRRVGRTGPSRAA